jgi:hypothetical protein
LECRQVSSTSGMISATSGSMSDFLEPQHFKCVLKAVQKVAGGTEESYKTPSNALKSGHHIKEMCAIKETFSIIAKDKDGMESAAQFLTLVKSNWAVEISTLACATLSERRYNTVVELPTPQDIAKLSSYLQNEEVKIRKIETAGEFRRACEVVQARLTSYNKRRPGEIEALR